MKQATQAEVFEQVLLLHTEMCFSVALALTRNPNRAQDLARHVITEAWQQRDSANGRHDIKKELLTALRRRYLHDCLEAGAVGKEAALAVCT